MTIMMEIGIVHPPFYFLKVSKIILGHFPFLQLWFVNSFKASEAIRPDYKRLTRIIEVDYFHFEMKKPMWACSSPKYDGRGPVRGAEV